MPTNTGQTYSPQAVALGCPPSASIGRRAIHVTIDFSLGSQFNLDLSQIQAQGGFDSVQTVYVDNRNGSGTLIIKTGVINQNITLPAGAQAYLPVIQSNPPQLSISAGSGTPVVDVFLMNFFLPPIVWYAVGGMPIVDTTLAAVITNGAVNVNSQPVTLQTPTDASGNITTGGTAQSLFGGSSATRKRWILGNPVTATEKLQFAYGNTGHYFDLQPGQIWDESDQAVSGDNIFVVAVTAGHTFTAYRWG